MFRSGYADELMAYVRIKNPGETEFLQAVEEVVESIWPYLEKHPVYRDAKVLERIVEPERVLMFRVPWVTDAGDVVIQQRVTGTTWRPPTQLDLQPGAEYFVHVDAYPHLHVTGKVQSIAPNTGATFSLVPQDTATGNFTKIVQRVPVKIVLDKEALASGLLRSGLQVTATVSTKPDCK